MSTRVGGTAARVGNATLTSYMPSELGEAEEEAMSKRRPSLATIVAMIALCLGLGGSAIAANELTKKDVRKIAKKVAKKQIEQRAVLKHEEGSLNVNSAKTADSAADAGALDGHDSAAFVRKAETFTGHWGCAGSAFENTRPADAYGLDSSLKVGPGLFRCSIDLPDGAIITEVRASVSDTGTGGISCTLWRTAMTGTEIGDEDLMGTTPTTSGSPGDTTLTDASISLNTIDNALFTYFIECGAENANTGLYGTNLTYQITGEQGVRG